MWGIVDKVYVLAESIRLPALFERSEVIRCARAGIWRRSRRKGDSEQC
jgi:hypothetical protein